MTTSTTTTPTTNNIYLNDYKSQLPTSDGNIWQHHGNDYNHTLQLVVVLVVMLVVIYIYVNDYKNNYKPDYKPDYQHQMAKYHVNSMVTTW